MKVLSFFVLAALIAISADAKPSECREAPLPIGKKAAQSNFIFVGKVLEENPANDVAGFNRKASIEVVQSIKGKIGKTIDVFYFVTGKMDECPSSKSMWSLDGYAKSRSSTLFYAKKVKGKNTISSIFWNNEPSPKALLAELRELDRLKIRNRW